ALGLDLALRPAPVDGRIACSGPRVEVDARLRRVELIVLVLRERDLSRKVQNLRITLQAAGIRLNRDLGAIGQYDIRLGLLQIDVIIVIGRLNGTRCRDVETAVPRIDASEARVLHDDRFDLLRRLFGVTDVDALDDRIDARPGEDQYGEAERRH